MSYFYHIHFCYFENVTNWCSVSYFYHIPSVILKMLPIDAQWVIFIIFLLLFWKCYQLILCELFLSYSFCYFENVTNWCSVSYFLSYSFLLFWKCYQLMLSELFLSYSFCCLENVTNWCYVSYFYNIHFCYFENVTNWCSVSYFYHIHFCYFENVTNWCSVSYFHHIPSVVLKMLPIDAQWVIFIIFLLLFWKC